MPKKIELTAEAKYELLKEISYKIRDTLDLDEILNHLLDILQNVMEYDAAGIFVLSRDFAHPRYHFPRQLIAGIASRGFDQRPPEEDQMLTLGKGIIGHVIKTAESVVIPDVRHDSRYVVGREKSLSEIAVPIIRNERAIGALDVESDTAGTFIEKDLDILSFFADAAAISIDKALLHLQILEKKKIEEQLKIASEVQSRLLPTDPPKISGYDFAGICIPTYEIGGDYFDYIPLGKDTLAVVVADVSGDGIPAALIMTAFRALLRTHAKNIQDPSQLMELLNSELSAFTRKRDFITAFYGVLNFKNHTFTFTNCGHNLPLLIRTGDTVNQRIEKLESSGPSLDILDDAQYKTKEIKLASGDQIVIYTDGVIEIFNKDSVEFGVERLMNIVQMSINQPASSIIQEIINATKEFSESEIYRDDYTLLIMKRDAG